MGHLTKAQLDKFIAKNTPKEINEDATKSIERLKEEFQFFEAKEKQDIFEYVNKVYEFKPNPYFDAYKYTFDASKVQVVGVSVTQASRHRDTYLEHKLYYSTDDKIYNITMKAKQFLCNRIAGKIKTAGRPLDRVNFSYDEFGEDNVNAYKRFMGIERGTLQSMVALYHQERGQVEISVEVENNNDNLPF